MAESEATQPQMKAVGGWKGDRDVAIYAAAAEQERLADAGLERVIVKFGDDEA